MRASTARGGGDRAIPGPQDERDPLAPCRGLPEDRLQGPRAPALQASGQPHTLYASALTLGAGQGPLQKPVQRTVERLHLRHGCVEVQTRADRLRPVIRLHGVDACARGPGSSFPAGRSELTDQGRGREAGQVAQGLDAEALEPLHHDRVDREHGDGAGAQKGEELLLLYDHGLSGPRFGRGHPGSELPRGPSHSHGGHQGAGKDREERSEHPVHLPRR